MPSDSPLVTGGTPENPRCDGGRTCPTDRRYDCVSGVCRIPSGQPCERTEQCTEGLECVGAAAGGNICNPPTTPAPATSETPEQPFVSITPRLGSSIPGLTLSDAKKEGNYISIPFLAQYVNAAYRYMVSIVLIATIVMVVYGGFRYLVGATLGDIQKGKKIIQDALVGMLIVLGAYMILNTINPETLNMRAIRLEFVSKIELDDFLIVEGNLADESAYAGYSGADIAEGPAGTWRARMMDSDLCIGNGLSLPTKAEKVAALKRIVDTWKHIGIDEGGAVYIRGGQPNCLDVTPVAGQYYFYQTSLSTGDDALLTREGVTGSCLTPIQHLRTITDRTERSNYAKNSSKTAGDSCGQAWGAAYNHLTTGLARERGLFCGDCFTTVMQLYRCFDRSALTLVRDMRPDPVACEPRGSESDYVFFLRRSESGAAIGEAALDAVIGRLRFGDVISFCKAPNSGTGHVFMYTGGVGLPYEMIEMGSGGSGDVGSGKTLAKKNSGTPLSVSGMQAYSSARAYLAPIVRNASNAAVSSWRIIPQ